MVLLVLWTCGGKWEDTSDFLDASVRVIFTPTLASLWHWVDISSFTRFYLGFVASAVFLEVCRYPLFFFLTLKEEGQEERQGQWSATCLESPF